jgi:hypothetical protein
MRLSISGLNENDVKEQREYAESILAIGEGRDNEFVINLNTDISGSIMKVGLSRMKYFLNNDIESALLWLYPNGFNINVMQTTCILSSKNDSVDVLNAVVQKLNPEQNNHE